MLLAIAMCSIVGTAASLSSKCFFLPNISLVGGTYDEFASDNIKKCCIACAKHPCCVAYTFSNRRCYMKSSIGVSNSELESVSGIKANTHAGQGASLRNVKIEGGHAAAIELESNVACQQYCTAYGIYSWMPPAEDAETPNGQCTCMIRIASLRYAFGAESAILPPDSNFN